jgi:prolipoprotein diacylglyceryltransferase
VVEFFRGDAARGLFFGGAVSTSQIIAVVVFIASLSMLWRLGRDQKLDHAQVKSAKK